MKLIRIQGNLNIISKLHSEKVQGTLNCLNCDENEMDCFEQEFDCSGAIIDDCICGLYWWR